MTPRLALSSRRCLSPMSSAIAGNSTLMPNREENKNAVHLRGSPKSLPVHPDTHSVSSAFSMLFRALYRDQKLGAMAVATAFIMGEGVLASQPAILLGKIVDDMAQLSSSPAVSSAVGLQEVAAMTPGDEIWQMVQFIGLAILGKELFTIGRKYLIENASTSLRKRMFIEQAKHILAVRVDSLQGSQVGDLAMRLDKSVEGVVKLHKLTFLDAVPNLATGCVALGYAAMSHSIIAGTMGGVLIVGSGLTYAQIKSQSGIRVSLNSQKAAMGGTVAELLANLGYIRASGMTGTEEERLVHFSEQLRSTEFLHHRWMMFFHGSKDLVEGAGFAIVVGTAITLAMSGEIGSGGVLTLAMLYTKAAEPLRQMHKVIDHTQEATVMIGGSAGIRNLPKDAGLDGWLFPSADTKDDTPPPPPIVASGLKVCLPSGGSRNDATQDAPVLVIRDLDLEVQWGEVVGLAGPSGSGKSTFLKVALGLVPDYQGSIELLGAEALSVNKEVLASIIAYAPQEPFLMAGTLRENLVTTPAHDRSDADLSRALARARLPLSDFSQGLDTPIFEAGRNLSGGQRQRLALARVFLQRGVRLIVLDEATSALDNTTEAQVLVEIHSHARETGASMIMVAHRLSTLRQTNRILVLDDGAIVQDAPFDVLEREEGIFRSLLESGNRKVGEIMIDNNDNHNDLIRP